MDEIKMKFNMFNLFYLKCGVDAFVNRRRKTINESSNVSDRVTVMNGHNHRVTQPIMNSKNVNVENKK